MTVERFLGRDEKGREMVREGAKEGRKEGRNGAAASYETVFIPA